MASLELEIADLDKKIADIAAQRDRFRPGTAQHGMLQRQISVLETHERAAITRRHAEQAERRSAEAGATAEAKQKVADEKRARARLFEDTPSSGITI